MNYYKLRIDINDASYADIVAMETKYFNAYIRVEEKGAGNPHYHYYIETLSTSVAIRQFIRKHFGKGNGRYSLTTVDSQYPLEYLSYLLKEDKNPVLVNIPGHVLVAAQEHSVQVREDISKNKSCPAWKKVEIHISNKYEIFPTDPLVIISETVDYYLSNNLMIRTFLVQSIAETILLKHSSNYKSRYVNNILNKIT